MKRRSIIAAALMFMVIPLLLTGIHLGIGRLLVEFPPLTQYVDHAPFSILKFFIYSLLFLTAITILIFPTWFGFRKGRNVTAVPTPSPMPWWGWAGIVLTIISWICAWGRFDWLGIIQDHTFFPLWLGYIFAVDGMVYRRTGCSRIAGRTGEFAALFPASAAAWGDFEFLNRFVQNWYYAGVEHYSAAQYIILATLSFSTVFPAIFATSDLLMSFQWFRTAYSNGPRWQTPSRNTLLCIMAVGTAGFAALGYYPVHLFFMTWVLPMAVLAPALSLAEIRTPFNHLKDGNYTDLFTLAIASLICGFLWEMWNFWSMPKWYYTIPYVQSMHIF